MKKTLLIIFSLLLSIMVIAALAFIIAKPAAKKQGKALHAKSISNLPKHVSASLPDFGPSAPLPESDRAAVMAKVKAFPQTLAGSGPPDIWADPNKPTDPNSAAVDAWQTIELKYPNGFEFQREYHYPDDPYINNNKAKAAEPGGFYGGRRADGSVIINPYQLVDINGREALAHEMIPPDDPEPGGRRGAMIRWYVKPFLYILWGPDDLPLKDVIPVAREITDFADKNIPPDLPPYAANTINGYLFPGQSPDMIGRFGPSPSGPGPGIQPSPPPDHGVRDKSAK